MNFELNKVSLKALARRQHAALKERGVTLKLSDVMESLAVSFEHRNLAHLYGAMKAESGQFVDSAAIQGWSRWVMYQYYDDDATSSTYESDVWGLLPEGTTLDNVASTDYKAVHNLLKKVGRFPDGYCLSAETTVLETYVECMKISKYGMPVAADEARVGAWVREDLGFREPTVGISTDVYDRGDDGGDTMFLLVALTDEDALLVRANMFPNT